MKRKVFTAVLSAFLALSLAAGLVPVGAEGDNMFRNGEFTRNSDSWTTWSNTPASSVFSLTDGKSGKCMSIENTAPVAASIFQFAQMKPGETYLMSADVRYENVSTDGEGVVLGATFYDSANNNIGEQKGGSRYGTSTDWEHIDLYVTIPQGVSSVNGGARLWFSTGRVFVDNLTLTHIEKTETVSGTYNLSVSDTANRFTVDALGCEWDPKLLLECNTRRGITEDDLTFMEQRMKDMKLQAVRMMICPEWFEPVNDNDDPASANAEGFNFDNDEMKTVFAYLGVCQRLGVRVNLTWWGAQTGWKWLSYNDFGDWLSAPNSLEEMTENIFYLLNYIRNDLKYTCVKGLILQNEPSYSFRVAGGGVDFDYYVRYYQMVHARLLAEGMSDIMLIGSDDSQHLGWFCKSYTALKDYCGAFNSHNYAWSYDTPYLNRLVADFISTRTAFASDRPFFLGEFGDGSTSGAYAAGSTATYGRGLFIASVAVNAFKHGASGLSYWPLHDVYYYEGNPGADNGGLMSMGLIGYKDNGQWQFRPTYYSWGLICNTIPYGSEIYDVTGDDGNIIDAVCVKAPDNGGWSVLAVNRSSEEQTVKISTSLFGTELDNYLFSESALPTDGSMIKPQGTVTPEDGVYTVTVPAYSFRVLSSIGKQTQSPGVGDTTSAVTSEPEETAPSSGEGSFPRSVAAVCIGAAVLAAAAVITVIIFKRKKK